MAKLPAKFGNGSDDPQRTSYKSGKKGTPKEAVKVIPKFLAAKKRGKGSK